MYDKKALTKKKGCIELPRLGQNYGKGGNFCTSVFSVFYDQAGI
jgi:hypothetical protein